ncbi:hypothetical protein AB6A40_006731 [Gnathostoma spinigerum]|uniref:Uncharacterized protein n=1 Tax=Gnathostoma spinigerum TaxID=75299 RepID=A0ABD6ELE3_9BILA
MKSLDLHTRIFGHLSSVFCVAFDRTGLYIFTGADDNLVKVWSAVDGLIRFTFRGHNAEISDMTVSHDNSLLATGSVDKSVRVWCLLTGATLAVFHSHTAMVTLISFLPYVEGNNRYLLSAGGDCTVNFYHYDAMTHTFDERPIRFGERTSTGARIVSSCHSPGGNLVVVGDTHRYLHIYRIIPNEGVFKVNDIDAHSDRVDSLDWAHSGLRFASGSRDGLAKIWKFEYCDWSVIVLDTKQRDEKSASCSRNAYKVTMLCWSLEDDFTVTSGSDHILRVWDSLNGNELRQLIGHKEDAFVLTSHPIFRQYVLSAGHDGLLMVWNILEGVLVKKHQNTIENCGNGALFDFAVSPDGTLVAAVDSYGHLSIYGIGTNQRAKTMPKDQFFHTDYMLLVGDASGFFLDEETELAPHLMPPPRLVDADGLPYSSEQQRLVPGRDLLRNDSDEGECLGPAWLNRYMVDPLPQSTLEIMNARCTELREQEMMDIDKETHRQRPVVEMVEDKALSLALVNDAARRRSAGTTRRRIHISAEFVDEESRTDEIASSASVDSSFMSTSTLTDEETTEESESTDEDTSDSDYEENQRRSYRSRRERVVDTDENSASSAPRSIRSEEANARPKRRRRVIIASDEDIDAIIENVIDENEPGPSGLNRGRHNSPPSNRKGSRMQTNGSAADKTSVTSKKLDLPKHKKTEPVILEFPNWMRMVRQLRFPYIAQVGDNVVYFRQGLLISRVLALN